MLCQNCGKKEAKTHLKKITNGETVELHLCPDCAFALGYTDVFSGFGINLSDFFGGFFGDTPVSAISNKTIRCEKCGSTFEDIAKSGKIGCADCYNLFYDKLLPSLQRIHGKTHHEGKLAKGAGEEVKRARKLTELKRKLNDAIDEQNFELAALIRDEIKEMEEGKNE